MKLRLLLLWILLPFLAGSQSSLDSTGYDIQLRFRFHRNIFPATWTAAPINGTGTSLARGEQERTRTVIRRSIAKYPPEIIKLNLVTVYVLKNMSFYGVGYGGTNSNDVVFLTNNGEELGYTDNYIEQTFHHEFSSILYRNYPLWLDAVAWNQVNPPDFNYRDPENGVGAIRNNESSQELDTVLCRHGFLTQYAMSGMENDINTIAQNLFRPSPGFWAAVDQYPAIREKTKILIRFYYRLHPRFTENYFRNLNQ
jgi:hypothetical protein